MAFQATSSLDRRAVADLRTRVAGHPVLRFYVETALEALQAGIDNRAVLLGADPRAVAISIDFDDVTIRTTFGPLSAAEIAEAVDTPRHAEFHLAIEHGEVARAALAARMLQRRTLRYYLLHTSEVPAIAADPRCRPFTSADLDRLRDFYHAHYPATIFSSWMLEQPFFGIAGDSGEVLACGGVVAAHQGLASANLGNFLTHPAHRGRGLARAVTTTLVDHLIGLGFREFTLGTFAENAPACRVYESAGFRLLEERVQMDVAPLARNA